MCVLRVCGVVVVVLVVLSKCGAEDEKSSSDRPYLPYPQGPFYGVPFDGKGALSRFLPFTLAGKCETNASYTITKISQLFDHSHELECIFAGGSVPEKMPEGPLHATCINSMNSRILNPIVEFIWRGKYIQQRECNGNFTFVGWNAWAQPLGATLYFVPRISPHNLNLAAGEPQDKEAGIVVEYSNDVLQYCPELKEEIIANEGAGGIAGVNYWSKNIPFMDFLRFVGRQEDGGDIYILKTYLRDWFREDRMATTAAFTAILNYDQDANPKAYLGIPTKPVEKEFTYLFPGLLDMITRGQPLDNLLFTPQQTWKQIRTEAAATRRSLFSLFRDIPLNYRRIWHYNKEFLKNYDADKTTAGNSTRARGYFP